MKPTRRNTTSVVLAFCLLGAAMASAQNARGVLDVRFAVTSTLHDFEGTASALEVSLAQDAAGTWSADVTIPVAQLKTLSVRPEQTFGDPERVRSSGKLPFVLAIKNVERPVEARVTHWQQSENTASFDADFTVSLAAFQLEAPQILFISVGDAVHVSVHLKLERT